MLHAVFSDPTLLLVLSLLFIAAIADTVTGIVAAIASHNLDIGLVDEFVTSHLLRKVFPLAAGGVFVGFVSYLLASFANADPAVQLGLKVVIGAAWATVIGGTVAYVTTTLYGIQGNVAATTNRDKGLPGVGEVTITSEVEADAGPLLAEIHKTVHAAVSDALVPVNAKAATVPATARPRARKPSPTP